MPTGIESGGGNTPLPVPPDSPVTPPSTAWSSTVTNSNNASTAV